MYDQFTRAQLHRNRVAYTKEELRDTSDLFKQYREISGGLAQIRDAVKKSIEKSVEGLKWKERKLSAPWIHKLLRKVLGIIPVPTLKPHRGTWQHGAKQGT